MKTALQPLISLAVSFLTFVTDAQDSPFKDRYWVITSSTISPPLDINMDGKPDNDLLIIRPSCEKDDSEQYRSDGTVVINRGKARCDDDEELIEETGTWIYDKKAKKLTIDKYDSRKEVVAFLESASSSEIILVSKHQSSAGIHTIRTTLKPKQI